MPRCEMCGEWPDCPWKTDPEIMCGEYHPKPITNADHIRAMTDEELAKYLAELEVEASEECSLNEYHNHGIVNEWLDWLKEEVVT